MKLWGLTLDQIAEVLAQNRNGPTVRVGDTRSIKRQAARNAARAAKKKPVTSLLPRAELEHTHTHTQIK